MSYEIRVTDETGRPHNIRNQDVVKEAITNEVLTFDAVGGVITELTCYDPEADCEIEGATFTASSPGVYRLRCVSLTQGPRQILVRVVDPSVLAAIPDHVAVGQGEAPTRRLVLRSVANHAPSWDGSSDAFFDGRVNLANHGVCVARS